LREPTAAKWEAPWNEILGWVRAEVDFAARRYRLPPSERDEMLQLACLRIVVAIRRFDPTNGGATLETWVRKQTAWAVADYWRARLSRPSTESLESLGDPSGSDRGIDVFRAELGSALRNCLAKITPAQRERFLATEAAYGTRGTLAEVARLHRVSVDTLKESTARARVLLRECLHRAGFSPAQGFAFPPEPPTDTVKGSA
jgi:RNA polymerase sigma factor (sigma-70 family)